MADFDIIAGTLRQNRTDRTKWEFFSDSDIAHVTVGFDPDPDMIHSNGYTKLHPQGGEDRILAYFKHTTDQRRISDVTGYYDKVVAVNASADETLTRDWGISVGAKVTRSGVLISGHMNRAIDGRVYYDPAIREWVVEDLSGNSGVHIRNWDSLAGILEVGHDWMPNKQVSLTPDLRDGAISAIYPPMLQRSEQDSFCVKFGRLDNLAMYPRVGTRSSGMSFSWSRNYAGRVRFDGEDGWSTIPWGVGQAGNIWVQGWMKP